MDTKCDYCDGFYDDQLESCPHCGATNKNIRRVSNQIPKTIEELKAYCRDNHVPVAQMHFYIGENYKGPKAFGIYRDGENVVVYKNKSDGSRAVRYSGKDEAYAVNEIYQKLRSEYANHKAANTSRIKAPSNTPYRRRTPDPKVQKKNKLKRLITTAIIIGAILLFIVAAASIPGDGYYTYGGNHYYNQSGSWYMYDDDYDDWMPAERPVDDINNYYDSSYYSSDYGGYDFSDSSYYVEPSYDSDSSWDSSDDSWDSWDSWDSGSDWDWDSGSDWDSDW